MPYRCCANLAHRPPGAADAANTGCAGFAYAHAPRDDLDGCKADGLRRLALAATPRERLVALRLTGDLPVSTVAEAADEDSDDEEDGSDEDVDEAGKPIKYKFEYKTGFAHLPRLLTIQLSRFSYDYSRGVPIKHNHRVEFPQVLNLSHLTEASPATEKKSKKRRKMKERRRYCNRYPFCLYNTLLVIHVSLARSRSFGQPREIYSRAR